MSESSVVMCLHICLMLPAVGGRALPGPSVDVGGRRGRSAAGEFRELPSSEALRHPGKWWNHPERRVHRQNELSLLQEGPLTTCLRSSNSLYFLFLRFIPFILYLDYVMISVPPLKSLYQKWKFWVITICLQINWISCLEISLTWTIIICYIFRVALFISFKAFGSKRSISV